jgi:16S rRNA (guanine1516-N2)-methyltransferase
VYVERRGISVRKLFERYQAEHIVIPSADGIQWHAKESEGRPFFFHPGLSLVRVKRLLEGQGDPMLTACSFRAGDDVLDCTAGLGSDAIVFSFAGGSRSTVTALESEFPLYYIVSHGLREYETEIPELNAALRRIHTVHADHASLLPGLPDKSVDIVYFDPMFRDPLRSSTGITPLRSFANERMVTAESVEEAKRIARKCVVLKEQRDSGEFERLGFTKDPRIHAKVAYGVIRV